MTDRIVTEILPTHTPALREQAVRRAAELLRAGRLVALPTETVYGLAANALDAAAVGRIFAAKNRPAHNPLIVHVADESMARRCVAGWPPVAAALARAFWPGPLTLVLPRAAIIPDVVTAAGPTVAVRWPAHPVMRAVIEACGFPLAAPSANPANRLSPTTARHVAEGLTGRVPLILDGGPCAVGIESTVLDATVAPPRVLRPGRIAAEEIAAIAGGPAETVSFTPTPAPRSPGRLPRHYAPRARLEVWQWPTTEALRARVRRRGWNPAQVGVLAHDRVPPRDAGFLRVTALPANPRDYARALYAALHQCDAAGARQILVESPPSDPAWAAIMDRLKRAAYPNFKASDSA
jgi:L-threonylcarbamoyladenylate synthase